MRHDAVFGIRGFEKRTFRFEKSARKERWLALSGLRGTLESKTARSKKQISSSISGLKYLKKPTLGEQISSPFADDAVGYRQL